MEYGGVGLVLSVSFSLCSLIPKEEDRILVIHFSLIRL